VTVPADLVLPAIDRETLREIAAWDGLRLASFAASDFPVDVVRLDGSSSPPIIVSRSKRTETLKALPGTLRTRVESAFERFARRPLHLLLANGRRLDLSEGPVLIGVVNVTPDSFSDGGVAFDAGAAIHRGLALLADGAAAVDVGGESTRPSSYGEAHEVPADEEIRRVKPVIEGLRRQSPAPISIDTRKAAVARAALDAGADCVNDVSALRFDPEMARTCGQARCGLILMHMRGRDPRTMQDDVTYAHPVAEVAGELAQAASRALEAGTAEDAIAVDPGLGFGKSPDGNLILLRHLAALRSTGFPVAVGASRKGFVRRFSGVADDAGNPERLAGSLACLAAARAAGASLLRVHDVADSMRFLRMLRAIERTAPREGPVRVSASSFARASSGAEASEDESEDRSR
jgi:dihydropteroate synthase